jgi:hypothetical protein
MCPLWLCAAFVPRLERLSFSTLPPLQAQSRKAVANCRQNGSPTNYHPPHMHGSFSEYRSPDVKFCFGDFRTPNSVCRPKIPSSLPRFFAAIECESNGSKLWVLAGPIIAIAFGHQVENLPVSPLSLMTRMTNAIDRLWPELMTPRMASSFSRYAGGIGFRKQQYWINFLRYPGKA